MLDTVIGVVTGAIVTYIVAELYFRRASRDMRRQLEFMEDTVVELQSMAERIEKTAEDIKNGKAKPPFDSDVYD